MFIISVYLEWVKCDECSCENGHVSEDRNGVVIPILSLLSAIFFFFLSFFWYIMMLVVVMSWVIVSMSV